MSHGVDETTFDIKRLAQVRKEVRQRSALMTWAWSPVIVLRIALVAVYFGYLYSSITAFIAGIPLFDLLGFMEGYTSVWAVLLFLSALFCFIAAFSNKFERLEKWASLVLMAVMAGYVIGMNLVAYGEGDVKRMFVGGIAFIAWVLPATRFGYLAAQTGKVAPSRD